MASLQIRSVNPYRDSVLSRWRSGHYDILEDKRISNFIRDILRHKLSRRHSSHRNGRTGDRRFFGEAYVASQLAHDHGWYGSFKWLTSPLCLTQESASGEYAGPFWAALRLHFKDCLPDVHASASRLCDLSNCRRPMPPDLWLITGGKHQFIEVKLRGDKVRDSQIAGLVVIASCLSGVASVSVEVIRAFSESEMRSVRAGKEEAEDLKMKETFERFCGFLKAS
jgi:hypothetical protein